MSAELSLWIMSDIHLELTGAWDLPSGEERPDFDVLIVAGDLVPKMERGVAWLLERVKDHPVLYIAGNHEFYGCDIDRTVEKARAAAHGTNVHVMQNDSVVIDSVRFVGATFWTNFDLFGNPRFAMSKAGEVMNDYRKIRRQHYGYRLRPTDTLIRHEQSAKYVKRATSQRRDVRKVVVITHHGCVREAAKIGTENDILTAAYTSDRTDLLPGVDLWIYGHMHETRDFTVGSTRIVSNSKGYGPWSPGGKSDNSGFDLNFVMKV